MVLTGFIGQMHMNVDYAIVYISTDCMLISCLFLSYSGVVFLAVSSLLIHKPHMYFLS